MNLLVNAIEAMSEVDEGARDLLVSSELVGNHQTESSEKQSQVQAKTKAHLVLVTVRDSGSGLQPGTERLFYAFYTTKHQGLGMGLAISRSIIQAHGGRLWTKPNAPRGAVFQFTLPIQE